jgi:hypothetical protein
MQSYYLQVGGAFIICSRPDPLARGAENSTGAALPLLFDHRMQVTENSTVGLRRESVDHFC